MCSQPSLPSFLGERPEAVQETVGLAAHSLASVTPGGAGWALTGPGTGTAGSSGAHTKGSFTFSPGGELSALFSSRPLERSQALSDGGRALGSFLTAPHLFPDPPHPFSLLHPQEMQTAFLALGVSQPRLPVSVLPSCLHTDDAAPERL